MPRLSTLMERKKLLHSHHWSRVAKYPAAAGRMPSMRWTDSTWMTSAPSCASNPVAAGPAHQLVRSSTFRPAKGSCPAVAGADGAGRVRAGTCPVCSPAAGAGPVSAGRWPLMR